MDLSQYIEDLLYSNDCVIIPTIGGFIVNYTPATLDFIEQQLHPPKKLVSFNPKLVNNDGLLANYIVQKEHLSYKQANQKVEAFIRQVEDDLFNNRLTYFNNIGKLYFNSDSKLEFVPENTNFNIDAYGLPSLACTPVLRSKDYLIQEQSNLHQNSKVVIKKREKGNSVLALITKPQALGAVAVVILLLMSPYIYNALFNNTTTIENNIVENNNNNTTTNSKEDSNKTQHASIIPSLTTTETTDTQKVETNETTEPNTNTTVDNSNNQEYIIVLGAFSKKANADRMAEQLEKDNYHPDVTPKNGLTRVGVIISCTPDELKKHLKFLQDNYNKKAWVVE